MQAQPPLQWWYTYNQQGRISEKWSTAFDANYRSYGALPFNSTLSALRAGGTYKWTPDLRITAGYSWFGTFVEDRERIWLHENRTYQQVQYQQRLPKFNLVHRIRVEQRWRERFVSIETDETRRDLNTRIRFLLQADGPIPRDESRSTRLRWQVANEIFFHTRERPGEERFEQNRTLAGVLASTEAGLSFAILYQFIYLQQPLTRQFDNVHSVRVTLFQQLDFRRGKASGRYEVPVID